MDRKLLEILKRAKSVDERAKKYDSVDVTSLEESVNSRVNTNNQTTQQTTTTINEKPLNVNSSDYKKVVSESKLPPEIQKLMLENPIQQVDPMSPSIDEEIIRELNPNHGVQKNNIVEDTYIQEQPKTNMGDSEIRKMIAEEISRVLPNIVEKYFDNKIIKENTRLMKVLLKESRNK